MEYNKLSAHDYKISDIKGSNTVGKKIGSNSLQSKNILRTHSTYFPGYPVIQGEDINFFEIYDKLNPRLPIKDRLITLSCFNRGDYDMALMLFKWDRLLFLIMEMLQTKTSNEAKNIMLSSISKIFTIQSPQKASMRSIIFKILTDNEDYYACGNELLSLLNGLTNNGRNLTGIERKITNFICHFLNDICHRKNEGDTSSLLLAGLNFLINLIKYNFTNLNDSDILQILDFLKTLISSRYFNLDISLSILEIMDVILRYGFIPDCGLENYIDLTCYLYESDEAKLKLHDIYKNLLRSHCAHKSFLLLCQRVEGSNQVNDFLTASAIELVRFLFSKSSLSNLSTFTLIYSEVLSALTISSEKKSAKINIEILRIINTILKNNLELLGYLEWDIILNVLFNLQLYYSSQETVEETYLTLFKNGEKEFIQLLYHAFTLYSQSVYTGPIRRLIDLISKHLPYLSPEFTFALFKYYDSNNELLPCDKNWIINIQCILKSFQNSDDIIFKQNVLDILARAYHDSKEFHIDELAEILILPLLSMINQEQGPNILFKILILCLDCIRLCNGLSYKRIIDLLYSYLTPSGGTLKYNAISENKIFNDKFVPITIILCYVFVECLNKSLEDDVIYIYNYLLTILSNINCLTSRVILINLFTSLRASSELLLQFSGPPITMSYVITILQHVILGIALPEDFQHSWISFPLIDSYLGDDDVNQLEYETRFSSENNTIYIKISDETITDSASNFVQIPFNNFLKIILELLSTEGEWRLFIIALKKLALQLTNHPLFSGCHDGINLLRHSLCYWITNNKLAESLKGLPETHKRGDLYSLAYKVMNSLLAYKANFSKTEGDEIIMAYQVGLRKWTQTSRLCIHSLTICCYELQLSMTKLLPSILIKLSQIMSTATISAHILEFLVCLARNPVLYANFTSEDFKRVFGIALQYIQYNSDSSIQNNPKDASKLIPVSPVNSTSNSRPVIPSQTNDEAHKKYVLFLAYQTISIWFISLKLNERHKYLNFILRGLYKASLHFKSRNELIDSCLDRLASFTFSNGGSTVKNDILDNFFTAQKGIITSKAWIRGDVIINVEHIPSLPWAKVTIRRASSCMAWLCDIGESWLDSNELTDDVITDLISNYGRNEQSFLDSGIIDVTAKEVSVSLKNLNSRPFLFSGNQVSPTTIHDTKNLSDKHAISKKILRDRSVILADTNQNNVFDPGFLTLGFEFNDSKEESKKPIAIPNDASFIRAIGVLDRTSILEFHKIGVLYVGPNQSDEVSILSNETGTKDYLEFLNNLGNKTRLKSSQGLYLGGLDTEYDMDGYYTLSWISPLSSMVFHVATMMPTNKGRDPNCSFKKRHIGNDYVSIVYNDSSLPYKFDTLPGQFNLINLILTPLPRAKNMKLYYRVQAQVRKDLPDLSPILEAKVISAECAPKLVRQLALNATLFAMMFLGGLEYKSHLSERLSQIRRISERLKLT